MLYIRVLGNDTERGGIQLERKEYHVNVNKSTLSAGTRLLSLAARRSSSSDDVGGPHHRHPGGIFYHVVVGNDDSCFHVNTSTG